VQRGSLYKQRDGIMGTPQVGAQYGATFAKDQTKNHLYVVKEQ